jgi:hypothetical protein
VTSRERSRGFRSRWTRRKKMDEKEMKMKKKWEDK